MSNYKEEEIKIFPVGLINLSRDTQRTKQYKHYKNSNLNNSCYINASIQCLFRLDGFVKNILKCKNGKLVSATKNLINNMQRTNNKYKSCSVFEIKQAMAEKNEIYENDYQEDANEFISNYLNDLLQETKNNGRISWKYLDKDETSFIDFYNKFYKRKGSSFIIDQFYGVLRTENYCKNCNYSFNIKFNAFNILDLPIDEEKYGYKFGEEIEINDLLRNFIAERDIEEVCANCGEDIKVKTTIYNLPKCLIIYFNREKSNNRKNKINVQKTLNFRKFVYDRSLNEDDNFYYNLKGIIFYSPYSSRGGHYQSACLVNNESWYYFNDNYYETDKNLLRIRDDENPSFLFYEK